MRDSLFGSWMLLVVSVFVVAGLVRVVDTPVGGTFRPASLLDPMNGLFRTARLADRPSTGPLEIPGLSAPVEVVRDDRGVPHIFAASDEDAIRAFGYVVAQDRLFQMDFLRRYTSGRLSEVMGEAALGTDRAMLQSGIEESVRRNLDDAVATGRMTAPLFEWFASGANAYVESLEERDLPFEFRLLDYRPESFEALDPALIGWNLVYDLTYRGERLTDRPEVAERFPPGEFDALFGLVRDRHVPIVPPEDAWWNARPPTPGTPLASGRPLSTAPSGSASGPEDLLGGWGEGFVDGKGSNNWAVGASRSTTGAPILAGDMHLSLTLPSIWYEVHLVTPTMDTYGVTVPGVPLPIEAFNRHIGWAFTNTGSDQIDHLLLDVDSERRAYRFEGEWRPLRYRPVAIGIRGSDTVIDSIAWTHQGPVRFDTEGRAVATRWVGHDTLRTFDALWEMSRATDYESFERALRLWDSPMQNILYAGLDGRIAIRSTGILPIRADGGAPGLRDGTSAGSEWVGRVPFEHLPHAIDPGRGYLTSTNQHPAGPDYPYYVGSYPEAMLRSLRIDALLAGKERHSPDDLARYQSDVVAVHAAWLNGLLADLVGLSPGGIRLRNVLATWDGTTSIDRFEPLAFDLALDALETTVWDEDVFRITGPPAISRTLTLLERDSAHAWFDRPSTTVVETARDVLTLAMDAAADSLTRLVGDAWERARWGDHHVLLLRHITMTPALSALWRGPLPFPGTDGTLSPGRGRRVTFSASWRVVLDFSGERPVGRGMYAGGSSGNPFSRRYDLQVEDFAGFRYRPLHTPTRPDALPDSVRWVTQSFVPSSTLAAVNRRIAARTMRFAPKAE